MQNFEKYITEQAKYFRTNNVIVTMGGDFTFMNADIYYKSLDRLIRWATEDQYVRELLAVIDWFQFGLTFIIPDILLLSFCVSMIRENRKQKYFDCYYL